MQRISGLITYPSLLVGLGNIVSMPLVLSIGRRPVYLASNLVLLIALILCATSKSFEWHFAARCIVAFAAAQSEATVPLIIQVCLPTSLSLSKRSVRTPSADKLPRIYSSSTNAPAPTKSGPLPKHSSNPLS